MNVVSTAGFVAEMVTVLKGLAVCVMTSFIEKANLMSTGTGRKT